MTFWCLRKLIRKGLYPPMPREILNLIVDWYVEYARIDDIRELPGMKLYNVDFDSTVRVYTMDTTPKRVRLSLVSCDGYYYIKCKSEGKYWISLLFRPQKRGIHGSLRTIYREFGKGDYIDFDWNKYGFISTFLIEELYSLD